MPGQHRRGFDRRKATLTGVAALLAVSAVAGAMWGATPAPERRTAVAVPTESPEQLEQWEYPLPLDDPSLDRGPLVVEREIKQERVIVIETIGPGRPAPSPKPGPKPFTLPPPFPVIPQPSFPAPSTSPSMPSEQRRAERCRRHPHRPKCKKLAPTPTPLPPLPVPNVTIGVP